MIGALYASVRKEAIRMNIEVSDIVWPIVILLIVIGVLAAIREWVFNKLVPVCSFISLIVYFILYPLKWVWRQICRLFKMLRRRLGIKRKKTMSFFGGVGVFVFMMFATLFSVTTIALIETGTVGRNGMFWYESLPLFALSHVFFVEEAVLALPAVFDFALLSAISFAFINQVRDLNKGVSIIYNLIFTVFGSCLLFWLPDTWYSPIANLFDHITSLWNNLPNVSVFIAILSVLCIILLVYVALAVYSLVIRELVVSAVYSLFPMAILFAVAYVLTLFPVPTWVEGLLAVVCVFGLSIFITQTREDFDAQWEDEEKEEEEKEEEEGEEKKEDLPAPTKKAPVPDDKAPTPTPTVPTCRPAPSPGDNKHLTTPTWKDRKS